MISWQFWATFVKKNDRGPSVSSCLISVLPRKSTCFSSGSMREVRRKQIELLCPVTLWDVIHLKFFFARVNSAASVAFGTKIKVKPEKPGLLPSPKLSKIQNPRLKYVGCDPHWRLSLWGIQSTHFWWSAHSFSQTTNIPLFWARAMDSFCTWGLVRLGDDEMDWRRTDSSMLRTHFPSRPWCNW